MLVKMNIRGRLVPLSALVVLLAIAWLFFLKKKPPSFVGKSEGTLQSLSGQPWKRIDNPVEDGWETEVLATEVSGQLDKLSALITADTEPGPGVLAAIAAGRFDPAAPPDRPPEPLYLRGPGAQAPAALS